MTQVRESRKIRRTKRITKLIETSNQLIDSSLISLTLLFQINHHVNNIILKPHYFQYAIKSA